VIFLVGVIAKQRARGLGDSGGFCWVHERVLLMGWSPVMRKEVTHAIGTRKFLGGKNGVSNDSCRGCRRE